QLAHLELAVPGDPTNRERKLTVRGRLTSSNDRIQASLNESGDAYQVINGNLRPIRSGVWATLAKLLPPEFPGMTISQIRAEWPTEETPSEATLLTTLIRCGPKAGVRRTDTKPAGWWLPT